MGNYSRAATFKRKSFSVSVTCYESCKRCKNPEKRNIVRKRV